MSEFSEAPLAEQQKTSSYRHKYSDESEEARKARLRAQVVAVSEHAGVKIQSPVYSNGELDHPWEYLKTHFPDRAQAYLRGLRDIKAREAQTRGEKVTTMDRKVLLRHRAEILYMNILDNVMRRHESLSRLTPEEAEEHKELQDWQVDVYQKILDFVDGRLYKGLLPEGFVELPTGTGKTVLFSEFVAASGLKSLIVVPNKILLEQTYEELSHVAKHRGIALDIGKFYGEEKRKRIGNDVTIAIYNSFSNDAKKEQSELQAAGFGLVVLDEAHRGLSPARKAALDGITDAVKIGFTATPEFNENHRVHNLLGREIYEMSVGEAVEKKLLAPPAFPRYLKTSIDMQGIKTKVKDGISDYEEADLAGRVNTRGRNLAAVNYYLEAEDIRDKTAVAYCVGVAHATALAKEFMNAGVRAAVISGETPDEERMKLLKEYRDGTIKVLCNADLLTEGFNEPRASVCLNLRPTKSWVVAEQRAGRVMRRDRKNPNKYAIFVEFIDDYGMNTEDRPVLVEDIYPPKTFLSEDDLEKRLASQSTSFVGKAEGEIVMMEDGTEVALFGTFEATKRFVPSHKEDEARIVSPWVTEGEMRRRFGLTDTGRWNMFVEMKKAYNPLQIKLPEADNTGTEYHISNYEEALLLQILPVLEELNEHVYAVQKKALSLPKFYKFFSSVIRERRKGMDTLKEFLEVMATKRKGKLGDISATITELESTRFMQHFRAFQTMQYNPSPQDKEFQEIRKYTEYLLDQADTPPPDPHGGFPIAA